MQNISENKIFVHLPSVLDCHSGFLVSKWSVCFSCMYVQFMPPLLLLLLWSCDIFLEVDEVKFVQSGFAQREEHQVEGEDQVVSADLFVFLPFLIRPGESFKMIVVGFFFVP